MTNKTSFAIGSRWHVERERDPFDFVIVEASRPGYKRCRIECVNPRMPGHGKVGEYSHKHLKKHARFVQAPDAKVGT